MLAIMSRRSAWQSREEWRSRAYACLSRVATPVRRTGDISVDKSNRCMDFFLRVEYADISLLGGREEHHDRVAVAVAEKAALLREGLISAEQAQTHPMRNFVECCLGGDPILPDMSLTRRRPLEPDDVLLACSDGLWGPLADAEIATGLGTPGELRAKLLELGTRAVQRAASASDNTSAAALRWLGD